MKLCEKKRKKRRRGLEDAGPIEKRILINGEFGVYRKRRSKENILMFQSQQIVTDKLEI